MLTYHLVPEGFMVTQTIHSFFKTEVSSIIYNEDISKCKHTNEPWRETDEGSRLWFEKYYRPKFDAMTSTVES